MLNLIKKDLLIGWFIFAGMAFLIPLVVILSIGSMQDTSLGVSPDVFLLIVIVVCCGPILILSSIDNRETTAPLFASLPVRRSTLIASHYATANILTAFGVLLLYLSFWAAIRLFALSNPLIQALFNWRGAAALFAFLSIIGALTLPYTILFGMERGTVLALLTLIGLILLAPAIRMAVNALSGLFAIDAGFWKRLIRSFLSFLDGAGTGQLLLLFTSAVVLINAISYWITVLFYQHKDL